jgi:hypothetical protein
VIKQKCFIFGFAILLMVSLFLMGCTKSTETIKTTTTTTVSSNTEGQNLLETRCTVCHDTKRIKSERKTKDNWGVTVDSMIKRGAKLNTEERQKVIDYLVETQKGI